MQRFKNILVFTDGGPRSRVALERAAALAKSNKARLTALSVLESLPVELQVSFRQECVTPIRRHFWNNPDRLVPIKARSARAIAFTEVALNGY